MSTSLPCASPVNPQNLNRGIFGVVMFRVRPSGASIQMPFQNVHIGGTTLSSANSCSRPDVHGTLKRHFISDLALALRCANSKRGTHALALEMDYRNRRPSINSSLMF